jgi:hypothetical protein
MHEDVTRKEGEIQQDLQAVAPFAVRAVDGKIMLDVSHAQVLFYAFLMARRSEGGEPIRH